MKITPIPADALEPIPLDLPPGVPLSRQTDGSVRIGHTRVHFWMVARMLDAGATLDEVLEQFPSLRKGQVKAIREFMTTHRTDVDAHLERLAQQEAIIERHTRDGAAQRKIAELLAERHVKVSG